MDAREVGRLVREHGATFLLATPTFLQVYTRRCEPGDFGSLRHVIVGAEKLSDRVSEAFRERFGVEPLEGYGCTECSPIVAINSPDFRSRGFRQVAAKRGRIGHPIPGVSVRIVDPETFAPLGAGEDGMLVVKGPNVMKGYLGRPPRPGPRHVNRTLLPGRSGALAARPTGRGRGIPLDLTAAAR